MTRVVGDERQAVLDAIAEEFKAFWAAAPITVNALERHDVGLVQTSEYRCAICQKHLRSTDPAVWKSHVRSSTHRWKLNLVEGRQAVLSALSRPTNYDPRISQFENYNTLDLIQHVSIRLLSGQVFFETDVSMDPQGCRVLYSYLASFLMVAEENLQLHFANAPIDQAVSLPGKDAWLGRAEQAVPQSPRIRPHIRGERCQLCRRRSHQTCICQGCHARVCLFCAHTYGRYQLNEPRITPCWGCAGGAGSLEMWARARALVLVPLPRHSICLE